MLKKILLATTLALSFASFGVAISHAEPRVESPTPSLEWPPSCNQDPDYPGCR
jgi:hypothetical protein